MKRHIAMAFALAFAAGSVCAKEITGVSVTATNTAGQITKVTLSFNVGTNSHLYALYGSSDGGQVFNNWENAEEVQAVAGDETSLTVTLLDAWKSSNYLRFLLATDTGRGEIGDAAGVQRIEAVTLLKNSGNNGGKSGVDTGLLVTKDTSVEMDVKPTNIIHAGYGFFGYRSGAINSTNKDNFEVLADARAANHQWRYEYGSTSARGNTNSNLYPTNDTRYLIKASPNGVLTANGTTVVPSTISGANAANISGTRSLFIFDYGNASGGPSNDGITGECYGVKVWGTGTESADTLTLSCVPCVTNGVPCLYDSVSGTYLGGGKFGSTAVKIANGTESSWTGAFMPKKLTKSISRVSTVRNTSGTLTNVKFTFTSGVASHLYAFCDSSDKGTTFDSWAKSVEIAAIAKEDTEYPLDVSSLPSGWTDATLRFCLVRDDGRIGIGSESGAQLIESVTVTNQSSGVDSGLKLSPRTSVMVDVTPTNLGSSAHGFCGARSTSYTTDGNSFAVYATPTYWRFDYGDKSSSRTKSATISNSSRYRLRTTPGGGLAVNGTQIFSDGEKNANSWNISDTFNLRLFDYFNEAKPGGIPNDGVAGTYYAVKAWGTGTNDAKKMTLDLVPCITNDVPCLYDRVSGAYLGGGKFSDHGGKVAMNGTLPVFAGALAMTSVQRSISDISVVRDVDGTMSAVTISLAAGATGRIYALYGASDGGEVFGSWTSSAEAATISGTEATNVTIAVESSWTTSGCLRFCLVNDDGYVAGSEAKPNGTEVAWSQLFATKKPREILDAYAVRGADGTITQVEFTFTKGVDGLLYAFYDDNDTTGWPVTSIPGNMTKCTVTIPGGYSSNVKFKLVGGDFAAVDEATFSSPCGFYTGLMASSNTTAELVITPSGLPSNDNRYFFGGWVAWENQGSSKRIFTVSSQGLKWGFGYGQNYINTSADISTVANNTKYTIRVEKYEASAGVTNTVLKVNDGARWFARTSTDAKEVVKCPIALFGRSKNGIIEDQLPAGTFYGFKVWGAGDSEPGTLSMDLVSCVVDGAVCLYDKVSGAYFGKGAFAATTLSSKPIPSGSSDIFDATDAFPKTLKPVVAWMRFDEKDPGAAIGSSDALYEECAGTTKGLCHSYTDINAASAAFDEYYPKYARPFHGNCVFDPVTGTRRKNRAALQFTTAANASEPKKLGAYYGGAAILNVSKGALCHTNANSAITVECFICTTGGVFDAIAPIVGVVTNVPSGTFVNTSIWAEEPWAIYLGQDGKLTLRFKGVEYDAVSKKVDDGVWHHVAMTWAGGAAGPKVYLDYECVTNITPRDGTAAGPFQYDGTSVMRIGGYRGYVVPQDDPTVAGFRRFPGLIDEVRVSQVALASDQFLRLEPLDPDVVEYLSFDNGPFGIALTTSVPVNDSTYSRVCYAKQTDGSATFHTAVPDKFIAPDMMSEAVTNTSSFYSATNSSGRAGYVKVPDITDAFGDDNLDYTVELFFKTRAANGVRNSTIDKSQTLFRIGEGALHNLAELSLNAETEGSLRFAFTTNGVVVGGGPASVSSGATTNHLDNKTWHHVAFVNDTRARSVKVYTDYKITHVATGVTPDWSAGQPLYVGCQPGGKQAFDGYIDECRVTRRALTVSEFLTTNSSATVANAALEPETLLLGKFDGDWKLIEQYDTLAGVAAARASGGEEPAFSNSIPLGRIRLDGTNGMHLVTNTNSMDVKKGYLKYGWSSLYELDEFTLEFFANMSSYSGEWKETRLFYMGDVAASPKRGFFSVGVRNRDGDFAGRALSSANVDALRVSLSTVGADGTAAYGIADMWTGRENFADDKWHHYAIRVTHRTPESASAFVELYVDYEKTWEWDLGGPVNSTALDFVEDGVTKGFHIGLSDVAAAAGLTTVSDKLYSGVIDTFRLSRGALPVEKFLAIRPVPCVFMFYK